MVPAVRERTARGYRERCMDRELLAVACPTIEDGWEAALAGIPGVPVA
jgi:hypothetical protein